MKRLMRTTRLAIVLGVTLAALCSPSPSAGQPPGSSSVQQEPGPVPVPEPTEKAVAYQRGGNALWLFANIWGLVVLAAILLTGFSARIRTVARRIGRKWFFVVGIYVILFSIVGFAIDLPLDYYTDFVRQHAYGLSNQTFGKWLGDALKGLAVGCVGGFLFAWIPFLTCGS